MICKFHEGREELELGTLALQCKKQDILRFCCILTRWPCAHVSPCFLHLLHVDNNSTASEHSLNDKTLIRMYGEGNSNPLPVSLPRKSHGQRTEAGYSPWDCKRVQHNLATRQQKTTMISYVEHFSCTCWPFESLCWKNVYFVSPILKLDHSFFSLLNYVSFFLSIFGC